MRLVAYEALTRSLTPIFNEKAMCGLGKGVVTTGRLPKEGIAKALTALRRFKVLCATMEISDIEVIATAAVRDAANGAPFLAAAREAIGQDIALLSGKREAQLSALGVISAIHTPNGVVGDLGGGSLELIDVAHTHIGKGVTLPLGGLALMDASGRSTREAVRIARKALVDAKPLDALRGRTFYAVGGAWRALARLHMRQRNYSLDVMHNYSIQTSEAAEFASLVERVDSEALSNIASVSAARRPLLAYGAIVLDEIIRRAKPKEIVVSAAGVREGLLYERSAGNGAQAGPVARRCATAQPNLVARARLWRRPHRLDRRFLCPLPTSTRPWTRRRLRHAACLLSDVGWRAHPDYRAEQATSIVTSTARSLASTILAAPILGLVAVLRHEGSDGRGRAVVARLVDDASACSRARARRGDSRRLSLVGVDAWRLGAHADACSQRLPRVRRRRPLCPTLSMNACKTALRRWRGSWESRPRSKQNFNTLPALSTKSPAQ